MNQGDPSGQSWLDGAFDDVFGQGSFNRTFGNGAAAWSDRTFGNGAEIISGNKYAQNSPYDSSYDLYKSKNIDNNIILDQIISYDSAANGDDVVLEAASYVLDFGIALKAGRWILGAAKEIGPLSGASFAQKTFRQTFSADGAFSGLTVADVAASLKAGKLSPTDVPVQYIVRDGNTLMLNTRSAQALERAGIPRSQWYAIDMTSDPAAEARLTGQLQRNGLTNKGVVTVHPIGEN